jgi:dsRNA-specific ribonuclease
LFLSGNLIKDETGIYKNLLQETAHRAGLNLPVYTTVRSGPGHVPVFTCTVELAGMNFTGEPAKTKKQAEKNAAIAAWSALKRCKNSIPYFLFVLTSIISLLAFSV